MVAIEVATWRWGRGSGWVGSSAGRKGKLRGRQSRERLDALALDRHQKPETVIPEWTSPVGMPQRR